VGKKKAVWPVNTALPVLKKKKNIPEVRTLSHLQTLGGALQRLNFGLYPPSALNHFVGVKEESFLWCCFTTELLRGRKGMEQFIETKQFANTCKPR